MTNYREIPISEVEEGDWFYHPRISNRKQKIPELDEETGMIHTVTAAVGSVAIPVDHPKITFYRTDSFIEEDCTPNDTEDAGKPTELDSDTDTDDSDTVTSTPTSKLDSYLSSVEGVGSSTKQNIFDAGINTLDDLYSADPDTLREIDNLGEKTVREIKLGLAE